VTSGSDFWCDQCDFSRHNVRGVAYALDEQGKRVFNAPETTGEVFETVCVACTHLYFRDPKADSESCPNCGAEALFEIQQMQNRPCPFCKKGTIASNQLDLFQ